MQAVDDKQEMAYKVLLVAPEGLGDFWIFHAVPFQTSTKVLPPEEPTAVQAVGAVHVTPWRALLVAPSGLGDACRFQGVTTAAATGGALVDVVAPAVLTPIPTAPKMDAAMTTVPATADTKARDTPTDRCMVLPALEPDRRDP